MARVSKKRSRFLLVCLVLFQSLLTSACARSEPGPPVLTGIDVLLERKADVLAGKNVGLITNHTGVNRELRPTIELLHNHPAIRLKALFAPEHGLQGIHRAGDAVSSFVDEHTGITVHSLYGDTRRPTPDMLENIDVLVFDIQDIGTRWYTYISTMALAMEEAAKHNKEFIVLDRPNPLGGVRVEGPVLEDTGSFVGMYRVPVVHGMTVGELALFYKDDNNIPVDLKVIKMDGWERDMNWEQTGLIWVPTSPHIPSFESTVHYPGMGLLGETGIVSVGVGYTLPFQVVGAPWISAHVLEEFLSARNLPGVVFRQSHFRPFSGFKFANSHCRGVQVHFADNSYRPLETAFYILEALRELYPGQVAREFNSARQRSFNLHLGTPDIANALLDGDPLDAVVRSWDGSLDEFREARKKYLLY